MPVEEPVAIRSVEERRISDQRRAVAHYDTVTIGTIRKGESSSVGFGRPSQDHQQEVGHLLAVP
jgi:hypothetical protein